MFRLDIGKHLFTDRVVKHRTGFLERGSVPFLAVFKGCLDNALNMHSLFIRLMDYMVPPT